MNINLPSFAYFNFDASLDSEKALQLLVYKPLSRVQEIKEIALSTIRHPITWVGVALGTVFSIVVTPLSIAITLLFILTVGTVLALKNVKTGKDVAGLIAGKFGNGLPIAYSQKIPVKKELQFSRIKYKEEKYSELVQKTITILAKEDNKDIIFCPITKQPMIIPIRIPGKESNPLFDINVLPKVLEGDTGGYPSYKEKLKEGKIKFDLAAGEKVIQAANRAFTAVEKILTQLPPKSSLNIKNEDFRYYLWTATIAGEKIFDNEELLQEKLRNSALFTADEAYTIAIYVSQTFMPSIILIANAASHMQEALEEDSEKIAEINAWHIALKDRIVPRECTVMRAIMELK